MLKQETFRRGIKAFLANYYPLNPPSDEVIQSWYVFLNDIPDKYFLKGIELMVKGDEKERLKTIYPNQSISDIFHSYAKKAREKELAMVEQIKEPWEIERYKAICENHKQTLEKSRQRLIDRRPELETILNSVFNGKMRLLNES